MADLPTHILSQELFAQYVARWLELVENPDGAGLRQCFAGKDGERQRAVRFALPHIGQLVSAVGAARIKASFVVVPGPGGQPRFAVVLAASNALDNRLTSYYLAEEVELPREDEGLLGAPDQATALALGATPGVLAREWVRRWRQAPQVEATQFANSYGYLRGYTFELSDFVAPLAGVQDLGGGSLLLRFGLHEYYRPGPDGRDVLGCTFGLLLQLRGATKEEGALQGDGDDDPVYDMSAPCPPSC